MFASAVAAALKGNGASAHKHITQIRFSRHCKEAEEAAARPSSSGGNNNNNNNNNRLPSLLLFRRYLCPSREK